MTKLGHVHLKVSGVPAAERFYCEVIGLKVQERVNDSFVFLSFGEAHHDVALQGVGSRIAPGGGRGDRGPGLYHSAFEVGSAKELLEKVGCLAAFGSRYTMVDHQISWAVYTEDPSGNGVEIFLDRRNAPSGSRSWSGESEYLGIDTLTEAARVEEEG